MITEQTKILIFPNCGNISNGVIIFNFGFKLATVENWSVIFPKWIPKRWLISVSIWVSIVTKLWTPVADGVWNGWFGILYVKCFYLKFVNKISKFFHLFCLGFYNLIKIHIFSHGFLVAIKNQQRQKSAKQQVAHNAIVSRATNLCGYRCICEYLNCLTENELCMCASVKLSNNEVTLNIPFISITIIWNLVYLYILYFGPHVKRYRKWCS